MKKNLTELVFILDRSGSMAGLEADTIGGFNAMIEKQKKQEGQALVSTVLFDHQRQVIHDRADLSQIPPMTDKEYEVRGCTALLDAVGFAIDHIEKVHKLVGEDNVPEHTLFVITTDGHENASKEFTTGQVRRMIEQRKEADHWEFLFLGANMDAVRTAGAMGIGADRAVSYHSDPVGTQLNYSVVSETIAKMRSNQKVGAEWKQKIEKDFLGRKQGRK